MLASVGTNYSLAHEIRSVVVHMRWPVQSYVLEGFVFALIVSHSSASSRGLIAFISWLLLCGGLTVFNSYYDKDEEPVGGMSTPPKVTISLLYGSLILQLVALVIAYVVGLNFLLFSIVVAAIYFFYSHKSFRLKSNGYLAVTLNSILGALTIMAASLVSGQGLTVPVVFGVLTAASFKASVYMMMQVHQVKEDLTRGDTSIAVMYGRNPTLKAALVFILIAGVFGTLAFYTALGNGLIAGLFLAYFLFMAYLFLRWIGRPADPARDYATIRNMIYYSGYVGSAVCVLVYAYLNLQPGWGTFGG